MEEPKYDFVAVDLHVHTPSSSCYKDDKDDEEYYRIVENYVKAGIKAIAITDHNTIAGYNKIEALRISYEKKLDILIEFENESEKINEEIIELKKRISVYNDILILPGIEFEAIPGIHLLFIFDKKKDLQSIEEFLNESGYSPY